MADYWYITLEYHAGYYAAKHNVPFDEKKNEYWKNGWHDGNSTIIDIDD